MSRFYDVLKQVSRTHQFDEPTEDGEHFFRVITPLQDPVAAPPESILADRQPSAPVAAPVAARVTAPALAADPWTATAHEEDGYRPPPVPNGPARNGKFAASPGITLDARARLIPNAIDAAVVEHYRRLRTKLVQQHAMKPFRTVVVTSANPQEGKTVTTLNIALSFAMVPSFRVAVVDGDLRRSSLGKWVGVTDQPGLCELIEGRCSLEDAILKCEDVPVHVIVSGTSEKEPAELLHSHSLNTTIQNLSDHFDLVLVDSPPINVVADAHLLASSSDAVLLVARAFATPRKELERAAHELQPFRVIGTILNGSTKAQLYKRYSGYY